MQPVKQPRHTLVDISGLVYQSLQSPAASEMSSKVKIKLSGQMYVLTKTLMRIAVHAPLVFVYDGYAKWRFDKYPNYQKAQVEGGRSSYSVKRAANGDEALYKQMKRQLFAYTGCYPVWSARSATNQADDVIASIIDKHPEIDFNVLTRDKDMLELLKYPNVRVMYIPPKGNVQVFTTREEVKKEVGVYPEQFSVFKAWLGDESDNLIRVPKVQKKMVIKNIIADTTDFEQTLINLERNRAGLQVSTNAKDWYPVCHNHIATARINHSVAGLNLNISDMAFYRYPGQPLHELQALFRRYAIQSINPAEVLQSYQVHNQMRCFLEA